nr:PREDICTED: dual specificity protein phosphatase 22 isoform X4 [Rhinolophus sinicus]
MTVTGFGWEDALRTVRAGRPCANPNLGFQRQLQSFDKHEVHQYRQWLKEEYGESPLRDTEEAKKILGLQRKALKLTSEMLLSQKQPMPVRTVRRTRGQQLKAAASPKTQGGMVGQQGARLPPEGSSRGLEKCVCVWGGDWFSECCLPLNESAPHLGSLLPQGKAPFSAHQVPGGVLLGVCALWH